MIGSIWAVFEFEWRRALTLSRMAWWGVLAGFPVFLCLLMRSTANARLPYELWAGFLFALVPMLVSMLGMLLWTSPAIAVELERRSWVYLAVRPNGSTAVLLGKYLAAIAWVLPPALIGLTVAVLASGTENGWRIWWSLTRLVCLACPAYGAMYLVIGTVMPRRAIVLSVGYTLVFEFVVSFVPAIINKFTIQYRLRSLFVRWCEIDLTEASRSSPMALVGDEPTWQHIAILGTLVVVLLGAAVGILRASEFSSSAESDV